MTGVIAVIPVKLSERLPGKHLMELGGKTILEIVYEKVSMVFDAVIYSRMDVPLKFIPDRSSDILDLVYNLRVEYGTFAMVGGDMPFFTPDDLRTLLSAFRGKPVTPIDSEGNIEPMFSIYAGHPSRTRNLREALKTSGTTYVGRERFSENAFFNINTMEDYNRAMELYIQ